MFRNIWSNDISPAQECLDCGTIVHGLKEMAEHICPTSKKHSYCMTSCEACNNPILCEIAERVRHGKPIVVTLCGSTRFKDEYINAQITETLKGNIVISVGLFGHKDTLIDPISNEKFKLDMNGPLKAMLDQLHFRKIDISDEILVINPGGYIGESTKNEIKYAKATGKTIRYLF